MPSFAAQVKAKVNIPKNRLHITVIGSVDGKMMEKLYTEIRFCVADLKPGFQVLSDISQCQLIYITGFPIYKTIIDYLIAHRVGEIVRITKINNISCKQVINFSDRICGYSPLYVHTREEAEQRLDEIAPRDGIRLKLRHLFFGYDSPVGSGKGTIVDISISGCAVENATLPLPVDMIIEGSIGFDQNPTLIGSVQMKAKIVRSECNSFAAQFLHLSDTCKEQLYQRFIYEVKHAQMDV